MTSTPKVPRQFIGCMVGEEGGTHKNVQTMRKKQISLLLLALCCAGSVQAQKLVVWFKDGRKTGYDLVERPKTFFVDNKLEIRTAYITATYPLQNVQKYTFEDLANDVQHPLDDQHTLVRQQGNRLLLENLPAGTPVLVYDANGKLLSRLTAEQQALTDVSLDSYPNGVYLIKVGDVSYKIVKQ